MRAVRCKAFGPPEDLVVEDVLSPNAGPGEIVMSVKACGVQFVDNRVVEGTSILNTNKLDAHYGRGMKLEVPFTPGMEASGYVKEIGPGVASVKTGDRVLGTCYIGGMAEEAVFQEDEVCRIPDEMDFETAACFFVSSFTSYYSLVTRAKLKAGETVLVLGAGSGVGVTAVQIAKAIGAYVVAAASTTEKLDIARSNGADALVRYPREAMDLATQKAFAGELRAASNGKGFDVVADIVGGSYAEPAMRSMAFGGRYVTIGFAAGIPSIPMHVILNKNGCIIGIEPASGEEERTPGTASTTMRQLFDWYRQGKLKISISETRPLEEAGVALRSLLDRKAVARVVLKT